MHVQNNCITHAEKKTFAFGRRGYAYLLFSF